jgi:hypothetical protein
LKTSPGFNRTIRDQHWDVIDKRIGASALDANDLAGWRELQRPEANRASQLFQNAGIKKSRGK